MIKLNKGPSPLVLSQNAAAWEGELMSYANQGMRVPDAVQNRYRQDGVKDALNVECNGKCMYCESKVGHVAYDHIEHVRPKAIGRYPQLTFEWSNLGLSCPRCNQNKGSEYDAGCPPLNPYVDDPVDHLLFLGPLVVAKAGSDRGVITERLLKLNRGELTERRQRKLERMAELMQSYARATNPALKSAIRQSIVEEIGDDRDYLACARAVIQQLGGI